MLKSPYQIGPITKEKIQYFIDRKAILDKITDILELAESGSQYQNVAVYGKRQIGKTSLLNKISSIAQEKKFLIIDFPIHGLILTSTFFSELHNSIIREGEKIGIFKKWAEKLSIIPKYLDKIKLDIPLVNLEISLHATEKKDTPVATHSLIEAFKNLSEESKRPILILIDEAQWLSENKELLQKLRNIFQRVQGFVFIFFGTEDMLDSLAKVFDAMERFFIRIPLGAYASYEDAREAIEFPIKLLRRSLSFSELNRYPEKFDQESINDIIDISQRHPYHINFFCHHSFLRSYKKNEKQVRFTAAVFKDIKSQETEITGNILSAEKKFISVPDGRREVLIALAKLKVASAVDITKYYEKDILKVNNKKKRKNKESENKESESEGDKLLLRDYTSKFSVQLNRLKDSGIVSEVPTFEKKKKSFEISDIYLRFYIKYIHE